MIAGGNLSGGAATNLVEVYSPTGKCQKSLASLPLPTSGATLMIQNGTIMACGGYGNQVSLRLRSQRLVCTLSAYRLSLMEGRVTLKYH